MFLLLPLGIVVALGATNAHSQTSATYGKRSGYASDQALRAEVRQRKARELWGSLSEGDKAFVRQAFETTHNFDLFSPDMLSLRANGLNEQALKMLSRYYDINDPVKARIIMDLLAFAHDQD